MEPVASSRYRWLLLGGSFFILFFGAGTWTSFGLFLKPLQNDFQWSRSTLSLAVSINMIVYGLSLPLVGRFADRFGPRRVILVGLSLMVLSTLLVSNISQPWHLYLFYGVGVGAGAACSSFVVHFTLLARWFKRRRGLALSITSAGSSTGTFLWFPILNLGILSFGWSQTYVGQGIVLFVVAIPLALFVLRDSPTSAASDRHAGGIDAEAGALTERGAAEDDRSDASLAAATAADEPSFTVRQAARTRVFWLLSLGQLGCGFTWMFIITHLVAFATDLGYSSSVGARALSLLGAANVVGNLSLGLISDRIGRPRPLGVSYLVRGAALLYMVYAKSLVSIFVFAAFAGFGLLATVPLTSSIAQRAYGLKNSGAILGNITFIHQLGAALGSLYGGFMYDIFGGYELAFLFAGIVALGSSTLSFMIREKPTAPVLAPAAGAASG